MSPDPLLVAIQAKNLALLLACKHRSQEQALKEERNWRILGLVQRNSPLPAGAQLVSQPPMPGAIIGDGSIYHGLFRCPNSALKTAQKWAVFPKSCNQETDFAFCALVPRYFFHLHNDIDVPDGEGKELPGIEAARANALSEAREMLAESAGSGRIDLNHFIEVRDETGAIVDRLSFGEAVEVIPGR